MYKDLLFKISVPGAPKLYFLQENKSACLFCSLSSAFYLIGYKISDNCFKDEITPSLKAKDSLQFSQGIESCKI